MHFPNLRTPVQFIPISTTISAEGDPVQIEGTPIKLKADEKIMSSRKVSNDAPAQQTTARIVVREDSRINFWKPSLYRVNFAGQVWVIDNSYPADLPSYYIVSLKLAK